MIQIWPDSHYSLKHFYFSVLFLPTNCLNLPTRYLNVTKRKLGGLVRGSLIHRYSVGCLIQTEPEQGVRTGDLVWGSVRSLSEFYKVIGLNAKSLRLGV